MNPAKTFLEKKFLEQGIKMVLRDPMKNINTLIGWADKVAKREDHKETIAAIRPYLQDPSNNWYQLTERVLTKTHPTVRQRMSINFLVNSIFLGIPRQREAEAELGVSVPWAILMDPTERCNLRCIGCWAGDYQRQRELDFATMDRVLTEAEELGIFFIVISGGEPLIRKDDLLALARKHEGQVFMVYTNGTLVDEKLAQDLANVGNVTLTLSLEGFKDTTDARRGQGVFDKVMHAMDLLRESGNIFGFSVTYTRHNTEELGSDEFIDMIIDKGAAYGWYFTYIPIGKDVDLELMATPEQRAWMYEQILRWRKTKPVFVADFWNDGETTNGCIAGGRRYFHINAAGEVEPCAFVHYATCNIHDVTLRQALQNPLFKAYQRRQPFDINPRRPCPIIDHPEALREMVLESKAYPTQLTANESVEEFTAKLERYAQVWGGIADQIWKEKQAGVPGTEEAAGPSSKETVVQTHGVV